MENGFFSLHLRQEAGGYWEAAVWDITLHNHAKIILNSVQTQVSLLFLGLLCWWTAWASTKSLKIVLENDVRLSSFTPTSKEWLEKEMATHSSVLSWRIPGIGYSMGSHRVGHDWSDLAAVAACFISSQFEPPSDCNRMRNLKWERPNWVQKTMRDNNKLLF